MRFLCCLLLMIAAFGFGVILAQESATEISDVAIDGSPESESQKPRFKVPQKAFGMGLVNSNPKVVANAMERALNKDRPQLVRRGLVFYTIVTRKRGQKIDQDAVTQVLSQASEILQARGYEKSIIDDLFTRAEFSE